MLKIPEKYKAKIKAFFQKPLQGDHNTGPENKAQPDSPQGRPMHRGVRSSPTQGRPGGQDTRHTAHPHSTAARAAQTPGRSTQSKRESVAATHAAHARHSGQGSEPRHRPCIR